MGRFLPELLYSLSNRNNAVVQAIRRQASVHRDKRQGGIGKDFVRNKDWRRPINRHTIYTGAPRRAFQLPVSHEIELKALRRRLWLPPYVRYNSPCVISEHVEMRSLATTRVLLTPPIECRETRLNVPVHGRCGERKSPKVQPSTRPGIEPRTSWLAVRDLTNCANLAHTTIGLYHDRKF